MTSNSRSQQEMNAVDAVPADIDRALTKMVTTYM